MIPGTRRGRLTGEIKKAVKSADAAGHGETLFGMLTRVLKTHLSMRRKLLKKFLTERAVGKFLEQNRSARRITSPVMLTPSKRDLVLLASGVWPVLFHNRAYSETKSRGRGLAVYLDVSGSVHDDLPRILGVLGNMQSDIEKVFTFSNGIVETSLKALAKGEGIRTTYGTDFDCVAASILERGYPKAVVITDGYFDPPYFKRDKGAVHYFQSYRVANSVLLGREWKEENLKPEDIVRGEPSTFTIGGETVTIPGGRIHRPARRLSCSGLWIVAPPDARPVVEPRQ